ncbi:amidohydrolase [Evansella sp. AB-rgal1]|uniref:amidohydrolase family protein n=1 Tax=Evansella sp. AB-rgal1 TaxID=3242696 RepID=UPI00359E6EC4
MMRIDAHQHYWKIDRNDYGWITPEVPVLYRDFLPEHLLPQLQKHNIEKTILVQAAPTIEESEFLLHLSEEDDTIAGVVGWLDLEDPLYLEHYSSFAKHPKFVGFRVMIQDMKDPNLILTKPYQEAFAYFSEKNVPIDLLITSDQLQVVVDLLDKQPKMRAVIDHIAKPNIKQGIMQPWKTQMERIANNPNIYCKLSGMVTEANHHSWMLQDFREYITHIIDCFGIDRIMFGSDWPVCILAGSYDEVLSILENNLPPYFTDLDKEKLFGLNAKTFYKI